MKNVFDAGDFGASPENKINTGAIQSAIDRCSESGGGTVLCGPGTFITGTIILKDNVELRLAGGCVLKGSGDIRDYADFSAPGFKPERAPEKTVKHFIGAVSARNAGISGHGSIDGSGLSFYTSEQIRDRKKPSERPRIVMFYGCENVSIEDVTLVDSPCWTVWLMKCENVSVRRVKIFGNPSLLNNDGIDIDSCRRVTVSDSIFETQDDCLVVRAISGVYEEPGICENVAVNNCIMSSRCNAVRVGCPQDSVIRDCVFSNITIRGPGNGIAMHHPVRYLCQGNAPADISGLIFSNFVISGARIPIWIDIEEGVFLKRLSGLSFSNFRITSRSPCRLTGSSSTAINDVSFSNVRVDTSGDDAIIFRNCADVRLNSVVFSNSKRL